MSGLHALDLIVLGCILLWIILALLCIGKRKKEGCGCCNRCHSCTGCKNGKKVKKSKKTEQPIAHLEKQV